MKKFAKVFNSKKLGQIVVLKRDYDGQPAIVVYFSVADDFDASSYSIVFGDGKTLKEKDFDDRDNAFECLRLEQYEAPIIEIIAETEDFGELELEEI